MKLWNEDDAAVSVPVAADFAEHRLNRVRVPSVKSGKPLSASEVPPLVRLGGTASARYPREVRETIDDARQMLFRARSVGGSAHPRNTARVAEPRDLSTVNESTDRSVTLPPPIHTAVGFAKEHIAALAVVCVVAMIFAVTQLFSARASEVPIVPVVTNMDPTPQATATEEPSIVVHVLGAVAVPGIVVLPADARAHDAIAACGGLTDEADPGELNLAQPLFDGAQLVVGTMGQPRGEINGGSGTGGNAAGSSTDNRLSLNTATQAQLETLPGVGPVTAGRIIAWREQHGGFTTTAELQEVSGIGVKTYAQIEPYVTV